MPRRRHLDRGLQRRKDRPFSIDSADYRLIRGDTPSADLVMSRISTNFDRTGFQEDVNVVFPIDRLREMAGAGVIGSVAAMHYAFIGATHPAKMEATARHLAGLLKQDAVDVALLACLTGLHARRGRAGSLSRAGEDGDRRESV